MKADEKMRVSPQRLFIPLLASFSLTGAAVVLLYFINKKKNDQKQNIRRKRVEQNSVEVIVPRQFVPVIIGRGGTMIQSIQESTNTKIRFREESDVDLLERICIITGSLENIKQAEERIKAILDNQPIIETYETWVPQRSIAKMTERGGEILNHIQNSSNAKIILESSHNVADSDAKKRVIIKGTAEQIANALLQIEDKIREDKDAKAKAESSTLARVPRIKTSPPPQAITPDNSPKDSNYSKEIFGNQANEGLMEVFVCSVENPSQFYIQVIGPTNAKLDPLVKDMTDYYESEENREMHTLTNITVGQMVAAKFSIDNKWYRGEIVAKLEDQLCEVYFVDFGDQDKVAEKDIFELRTDFLSLRVQAIECCLAGVKPRSGEWSGESTEAFGQLCALANWQPRVAKIRGYKERPVGLGPSRREGSPIPCIELYDHRDDQLINIGKELIKLELAVAENEPWSAASSTLSLSRQAKSPETSPANGTGLSNGSNNSVIEEIDLTAETPQKPKPQNIEVIDLTSPSKDSRRNNKNVNSSRSLLDSERGSQLTSNGKPRGKPLPANPFKRESQQPTRNIVPAGYEDSDESDMEYY
ncbi:hypothetical protein TSAR_007631 [Trichomalopsis sarcophagae]|uniref:Tudor domain-containing protein n=1 Tax=Trichomalopsis sarcophagae TaxID=543379 RepID=A0A232FI95_9HYME|nr:hypothetical protein TSAR_007631 [Trichomalopsis sarcophagae]